MILDDVESQDNTATSDSRAKLHDWFGKAVLKAGTPRTNVVVIGTIQHYDALDGPATTCHGGRQMRIYKLTVIAQRIVQSLDAGRANSISVEELASSLGSGRIFKLLCERLEIAVPLSILTPADRLELLMEWTDLEGTYAPHELGIERSGLRLLLYWLLEGIQRRASNPDYRLTSELAAKDR